MAYYEWGDPDNHEIVLCVHGLTRTGRDFDALARVLSARYRVICPDVAGRGLSDWLSNSALYALPQYVADMVTLIARLQPERLHWLGTSMGGLIGLVYAGALAQTRISSPPLTPAQRDTTLPSTHFRLDSIILNDVGPHLESAALARIGLYVGENVSFSSFDQAVQYVRMTCESFGHHTPEQWADLTRYVYIEHDGKWVKHYDLSVAEPFKHSTPELAAQGETFLWGAFASITSPIHIIRGQQSDLLSEQTCQKMLQYQPHAHLTQIAGVGHAPTLMETDQINVAKDFLFTLREQDSLAFGR
jgi:pimeloyl-ACP methyl ester carboxylesterase